MKFSNLFTNNEKLIYFISQTRFDCNGIPSISFLCSQNNNWGTYWSRDFNNEYLNKYESEKEAVSHIQGFNGSAVHSKWIKLDN